MSKTYRRPQSHSSVSVLDNPAEVGRGRTPRKTSVNAEGHSVLILFQFCSHPLASIRNVPKHFYPHTLPQQHRNNGTVIRKDDRAGTEDFQIARLRLSSKGVRQKEVQLETITTTTTSSIHWLG